MDERNQNFWKSNIIAALDSEIYVFPLRSQNTCKFDTGRASWEIVTIPISASIATLKFVHIEVAENFKQNSVQKSKSNKSCKISVCKDH